MGDGFTGISIDEVKEQLDKLQLDLKDAHRLFKDRFNEFNECLYNNWYSEIAYDFNKCLSEMAGIKAKLAYDANHLMEDAVNAAKTMARNNGAIFSYDIQSIKGDDAYRKLEKYKDRRTCGMNIKVVSEEYEYFKGAISYVLNILSNTQINISLYDDSGLLKGLFETRINKMNDYISKVIEYADAEMNEGIEEAKGHLYIGKSDAQSSLEKQQIL